MVNIPSKPLKILIISTIVLPVSKKLEYAGTERVIYNLNKELSKLKNIKTVVAATGDADLGGYGELIYLFDKSIWPLNQSERKISEDITQQNERHFEFCLDYATKHNFDLIHDHAGLLNSSIYKKRKNEIKIPIITTIHGNIDDQAIKTYEDWRNLQKEKRRVYFIALSKSHKENFQKFTGVKIFDYVYNGIEVEDYPFVEKKNDPSYLFWLGRITSVKGTDLAIKLAKYLKRPLILAGEIHTPNKDFYEKEIKPFITRFIPGDNFDQQVENRNILVEKLENNQRIIENDEIFYIGPVNDYQKGILNKHADVFLMLNRWKEPFGLVMPEAMVTGTPVIGTKTGSIPEIVEDKKTGFVIPVKWINKVAMTLDEDELIKKAAEAFKQIFYIRPEDCHEHVRKFFGSEVMAKSYMKVYCNALRMTTKL